MRELVRYRAKLVALRSGLKAQVHAVLAKQGVLPKLDDLFGPEGQRFLDDTDQLGEPGGGGEAGGPGHGPHCGVVVTVLSPAAMGGSGRHRG